MTTRWGAYPLACAVARFGGLGAPAEAAGGRGIGCRPSRPARRHPPPLTRHLAPTRESPYFSKVTRGPAILLGSLAAPAPRVAFVVALGLAVGSGGCAARPHLYGDVSIEQGQSRRSLSRDVMLRHSAGVAFISTDVGRGMGFVVDPDGYLLTNRHVVEDADHVEDVVLPATAPPRRYRRVRISYIDPVRDLALLKIDADEPLPYLKLATASDTPVERYLTTLDTVTVWQRVDLRPFEYGAGKVKLVARGSKVSKLDVINPLAGPGAFVGLSADVKEGQSGGPVLDRYGRAVGVVTWAWRGEKGGYAIPINEATRMLSERPDLEGDAARQRRARDRARTFVLALGKEDLGKARRMTSPSYAKQVRERTVSAVASQAQEAGGEAMRDFLGALEAISTKDESVDYDTIQAQLTDIVVRTGTDKFREALGIDAAVPREQVMMFFHEFGGAYLSARRYGERNPADALDAAMQRLQTVDAARTFALARLMAELGGTSLQIERVELVPGAYAPRAVVTLRLLGAPATTRDGKLGLERATVQGLDESPDPRSRGSVRNLHLRLEWGDWYVADVT